MGKADKIYTFQIQFLDYEGQTVGQKSFQDIIRIITFLFDFLILASCGRIPLWIMYHFLVYISSYNAGTSIRGGTSILGCQFFRLYYITLQIVILQDIFLRSVSR